MITLPIVTQSYTVLVHEAEEGGYWAEILELPGCVSQGETLDELHRNIREALEAVLSSQPEGPRLEFQIEPTLAEKDTIVLSDVRQTWTAAQ